jgi:cobalt-zinc-cadmium efflux system protein
MGSGHDHSSAAIAAPRKRLLAVLLISAVILVVEVIGAVRSGSLALLADAGHMLTDVAGVALALLAVTFAAKKASPERTFGHYRFEILAAVANAVLLFGVSIYLLIESWSRWTSPHEVDGGIVLIFAGIGVVANLVSFFILRGGAKDSLNVRGAYLEVVGDLLGSITVIIAAVIIMATGWERADALASAIVALMMLPRTWSLLREAVDVLLEAAPKGVNIAEVRAHILEVDGVIDTHDLHIWTITSGQPVMSAHVVVSDETLATGSARVLDELHECLGHHFDVSHCTFQIEGVGQAEREGAGHP